MQEAMAGKITRGVMAAQMAKTARALHAEGDALSTHPEYTRGQVELVCNAAGLSTDEFRDDVESFITYQTGDAEFGLVLARAVFSR
jgi:hypothetical protein